MCESAETRAIEECKRWPTRMHTLDVWDVSRTGFVQKNGEIDVEHRSDDSTRIFLRVACNLTVEKRDKNQKPQSNRSVGRLHTAVMIICSTFIQ